MSQRTSPPNNTPSFGLALLLTLLTAFEPLAGIPALKPALAQAPTPSFSPPNVLPKGTTVRVDGSSSMATINGALKKAYEAKYAGTSVSLAEEGSDAALKALVDGKIDLAAIGRALTAQEKQQGLVAAPIARQKIAILVGPNNPFTGNITFEQFAKIFRGEITDWSELGGTPGTIRFVDRPAFSDTRQAFRPYPVFQKAPFKAGEKTQPTAKDSTDEVAQALGTDGIGYAIADQVFDRKDVRIVSMHKTLPSDPRYPFSQPLAYVYKGTPSPAIAAFLSVATAPESQAAIEAARKAGATAAASGTPIPVSPSVPATASPSASESPTVASSPPDSATGSPNAAIIPSGTDTDGRGGFPWWLLLIPLLGGLLWFFFKGRRTAPEPIVPPTAAAPPDRPLTPPPVSTPPTAPLVPEVPTADATIPAVPATGLPVDSAAIAGGAALAAGAGVAGLAGLAGSADRGATIESPVVEPPVVEPPTAIEPPVVAPLMVDPPTAIEPPMEALMIEPPTAIELPIEPPVDTLAPSLQDPSLNSPPIDPPAVETAAPAATLPDGGIPGAALAGGILAGGALAAGVGAAALTGLAGNTPRSTITLTPQNETVSSDAVSDRPQATAAWDAPDAHKATLRQQGGRILALRLYDVTDIDLETKRPQSFQEFAVAEDAVNHTMPIQPNRDYIAEIGYITEDRYWLALARSNSIRVPLESDVAVGGVLGGVALGAGLATAAALGNPAQTNVEAAKYNVGQSDLSSEALASVDEGLADLPEGYGDSRIVLMPRDPQWGYAYWDVPSEHKEALRQQGGQRLALRLYDVTDVDLNHQSAHSLQQYDCDELARDWYVPIPVSDRDYLAEIGYLTADGHWLSLARSNPVRIPPVYPSDWLEDRFLSVAWDDDLRGSTLVELLSPTQRAVTASPLYDQLFGMAQSTEALRVAGSLFGSMQHIPGSGQQMPLQAVSSYVFPSGAGLGFAPGMPGVPNVSGLTMSGMGMSGIGMSGIGFGSMPPLRARKFWLVADAELIVYGATEPDATVTIDGRPIQLNPDGTFRFHLSFQDGVINFPIIAVAADGEQSRSIHMTFERETPYRQTNIKDEAVDELF